MGQGQALYRRLLDVGGHLREQLVSQIDRFAQSHNMTRSAFLAAAAKDKMGAELRGR